MAVPLPNRATLDAARKRAEGERAFWDANRAELTATYPDEYIAIRNGEVVDHDIDLMVLAARLQDHGIRLTEVSIEFMASTPQCYLL
jgi:hypothetical protein